MELKTPLYECHLEANGKIVPFAGYLLPVQYETGVIAEHMAVRERAGLFDVSHMGEVVLKGPDAFANIQNLLCNDYSSLADGRVRYSPLCNDAGGIVDDLLVYRRAADDYFIVVNAANRAKDVEWIKSKLFGNVEFCDISDDVAQIALQGPRARQILEKLVPAEKIPEKYYSFADGVSVGGIACLLSKTGYTGEDGFELYCAPADAPALWKKLLKTGAPDGLIPCGLGARDTLRLEAAMPLYGHEMDDTISPFETGLGMFAKMAKENFVGKAAILARGEPKIARVGLEMIGRGIARENCDVFIDDKKIGRTTSGTHCPFLGKPFAMAFVCKECASEPGTLVDVDVRGRRVRAKVVPLPFYKSAK